MSTGGSLDGDPAMKTFLDCISRITLNDPDLAEDLLDTILWASTPGIRQTPEYDEALDFLYARTPDCRSHRDLYVKSRAA